MKTSKLKLFIILISGIYFPCDGQEPLFNDVLAAHRIYKDISYFNVKKIVKDTGKDSELFAEGMETDSVIQQRRAMINTLANNLDLLSPEDSEEAKAIIHLYISQAKELESKSNKISTARVRDISDSFAVSNAIVSSKYQVLDMQSDKLFSLLASRHLDVDIRFTDPLNENNYIAYIFPKIHIYSMYRECFTTKEMPDSITLCRDALERYAHKWFSGKGPTISNLGTGPYYLIVVNKNTRKVIYHEEVFIPSKDNKLNLTLKSENNG